MTLLLFLQALFLGIIEGLTEFLPVSSTAHLLIFGKLVAFNGPPGEVFEIVIQLGAILAVCWAYRILLIETVTHLHVQGEARDFVRNLILGFLPAGIIGFFGHHLIKETLFDFRIIAVALIAGALIIMIVEAVKPPPRVHKVTEFSWKLALLIGCFQALAVIPGLSRAGATIVGALLLGADRRAATEFSFFLAIPTIFAAAGYDLYQNFDKLSDSNFLTIIVGFVAAFFSALLVVRTVIGFVSRHGFNPFAWYRLFLGAALLAWLYV